MASNRFISAAVDHNGFVWRDDAPGQVLPWWSFTKTVISACLLLRAQEGGLDLDVPMVGKEFTARQVMAHVAGLRDYSTVGRYHSAVEAGETPWTPAQMMEEARGDDLLWVPGKGWQYSNIGYMLLRFLLEVSEGADLGQIVQRRIAGPLGLDTVRLARQPKDFKDLPWPSNGYHPGWVYHGCLMGSAADAARLMQALIDGTLLSQGQIEDMITPYMQGGAISGRIWTSASYGLGLMIGMTETAGPAIGHAGCGPISANLVAHFPERKVTVASFVQGGDEAPAEWEATRIAASR